MEKMSPGQLRIHCQPATSAQKMAFASIKRPEALYSPNMPLGKNSITQLFAEAGVLLALENPLKGHSLRRMAITKMATGGVSVQEIMATARHTSVAAAVTYMSRTDDSNAKKIKALGINLPSTK